MPMAEADIKTLLVPLSCLASMARQGDYFLFLRYLVIFGALLFHYRL